MNTSPTILITGASSGIGAALAVGYAAPGVTLLLIARNEARLSAVATECRVRGAQVKTALLDVRDRDAMAAWITAADAATPIDLLIANAGISAGGFAGHQATAQSDEVFAVNVTGVLNSIHPLLARMVARGRGHIAIMSSLAGIRALPSAPAYSASKAAVRVYGDALRGELKPHGIAVSVICPGWITTPLVATNDFPMPLIMSEKRAAAIIMRNLCKKKSRIAFPLRLYIPLLILAALPNFLTDWMFNSLPGK
ncbi:MAG: SDR family NAD(P)-dependent oxidoreductase [Pseudomonadota bacterium]